MRYYLKYRQHADATPLEERFDTEKEALIRAFASLSNLAHDIWIEDDRGAVVVSQEDIRHRSVHAVTPPDNS